MQLRNFIAFGAFILGFHLSALFEAPMIAVCSVPFVSSLVGNMVGRRIEDEIQPKQISIRPLLSIIAIGYSFIILLRILVALFGILLKS
jgi:hypothetical protein